jgi:DNA-binding MarR family transcriptional regulator
MDHHEALRLDRQLCFALYTASREIIRQYRPFLEPLGLTYTQYIAMLALWEEDGVTITGLGDRLLLDSGTLTPLLKKLENQGLVLRQRDSEDERMVRIHLTGEGKALKERAAGVPYSMACATGLGADDIEALRGGLSGLVGSLRVRGQRMDRPDVLAGKKE